MDGYRKLLILAVNEAVRQGKISLDAPASDAPTDENGHLFTELAGFPSVVIWSSINVGELRISVWWDYDHSRHPQAESLGNARETFTSAEPLAKRSAYSKFVGATASAWLERKTGKYIQGYGKDNIIYTYLRTNMREKLRAIPDPKPVGYGAEGKFFS